MAGKKVKIMIKPLHGIGGVGDAGTVACMDEKEAKQYEQEGYLEILSDEEPAAPPAETQPKLEGEDHKIMKPQSRRRKK